MTVRKAHTDKDYFELQVGPDIANVPPGFGLTIDGDPVVKTAGTLGNNVLLRGAGTSAIDSISGTGSALIRTNSTGDLLQIVPTEFGTASYELQDDQSTTRVSLEYDNNSVTAGLTTTVAFAIQTSSTLAISSGISDVFPAMSLEATGTNGAKVEIGVGDRSPLGNVPGVGGRVHVEVDGDTSSLWWNAGVGTNSDGWRRASGDSEDVTFVWSLSNLPAPVSGVITLTTGLYIQKAAINFGTNRLDITGATVQWRTEDSFNHTITYEGTSAFIFSTDVGTWRTFDPGLTFVFTADGGTFIDVIGSVGLQFITIFFTHANGGHLGDFRGSFTGLLTQGRFFWVSSGVEGWVTGLNVSGAGRSYADTGTITSHANATGGFFNIKGSTAIFNLSRLEFVINNANASAINVDPTNEAPINIERSLQTGVGGFFQAGTTGTFTAVADASIGATAITSVTNSSGTARFNFTGPTVFVNQKVVISGFTTNPDYNGTFLITSTDGTTQFEIDGIDFGSDESGSFLSDSVTLTDTATTLVDGDTIFIDTDLSIDYRGGSEVYNKLTNSVQVNKSIGATPATGTWDTGSLTHTSEFINTRLNGDEPNSANIAYGNMNSNTNTTSVSDGAYGVVDVTGFAESGFSELFKLIDDVEGVYTYTGREPRSQDVLIAGWVRKTGSTENYRMTTSKNGATPVFATAFGAPVEVKTTKVPFTLDIIESLVTGDTIQLMAAGDGTADAITITDISFRMKG